MENQHSSSLENFTEFDPNESSSKEENLFLVQELNPDQRQELRELLNELL